MAIRSLQIARGLTAVPLLLLALGSAAHPAAAAGPRALTLNDFGDQIQAQDISASAEDAVAGVKYRHAIGLATVGTYVTLFPHKFPGYTALAFKVGISDSASPDTKGTLVISVDGQPFKTIGRSYGQSAVPVVVPFGKHDHITLTANPNGEAVDDLVIGDPVVQTTQAPSGPGATTTHLRVLSAAVNSGSQESVLVGTQPSASVTVVVTYATGVQQVVGPSRAGADGNFVGTWTVPTGAHGVARVTAVSTSVAVGSFIVG